ncbi:MAG: helix-turn-helix domain-containing protein, partial [Treponema sp.]
MNNVGGILSEARREKGVDLAQVEQDTNIERVYIEALENDEYQKIPAEAYIVGFLRNYSEYLGLNPNDIIKQYKNIKIENTDVPQEILLPKKKLTASMKIVLFIVLALFIVGVVYVSLAFLLSYRSERGANDAQMENTSEKHETRKTEVYEIIQDELFEKEVFLGDKIMATIEGEQYIVEVLQTSPVVKFNIADSVQLVELTQTRSFDLNGDVNSDIEITVNDISEENGGASISIASGSDIGSANLASSSSADELFSSTEKSTRNLEKTKVLFQGTHPYPVILNATFRGYCLFRTEID